MIEAGSDKKMQSPSLLNCDFFPDGGVAKRLGKEKQGDTVAGSSTINTQTSQTTFRAASGGSGPIVAGKIVAGATASITSITTKLSIMENGFAPSAFDVEARIYSDSPGQPATLLGTGASQTISTQGGAAPGTLATLSFTFPTPVSVTSGTAYWIAFASPFMGTGYTLNVGAVASGSANVASSSNGGSTWSTANFDLYYLVYASTSASVIQGVYDYRYGATSTQKQMAVADGNLTWNNGGTWTSLITGLGSGANNLWAFATLRDYLFTCDYGNNPSRVWNGQASYTTKLGFQATYSLAAAAGGAVTAGTYKVMAVTTLISGGYRASTPVSVTTSGGNLTIAATSVVMDGTSAANFGFDIAATATKWFMTADGGTIYYKIPTGNLSTAANPMANNVTSFNITALTGLTTANTLLDEYGLEQAYFTAQVASPTGKYLAVFQNMLALGGDASYPSRVWFSGLNDGTNLAGPQIWSTVGGVYGNYRDVDAQDGEVLTGIKEWNGNLYAFKRHSVHLISFTGVATQPFEVRRLSGTLGALSHWSIKETQRGLVFMSERGPCICTGTSLQIIPSAKNILDRFNPGDSDSYNLAAMQYTTAGNNSTKMQVHWGVSSHSATTRDLTLVYDYEHDCFWENSVSANYYTEVTDSNFFPYIWSGDYSAQVFKHDTGTTDNGSAISWYLETPNIVLGKPFNFKAIDHIFVSGEVQSSGTLTVEVYTDFSSTVATTMTFDMSAAAFKRGNIKPLNLICTAVRLKLSNSELSVPVQINSIGFAWDDKGLRNG